jgi:hypothetical protein
MQVDAVLQNKPKFLDKEAWHHHFTTCKQVGCSKVDYSNQNNLVYHQFIYWCRKFEEKNVLPAQDDNFQFVPITIKSDKSSSKILCTLEFNDGKRLLIHDMLVVETLMSRA